MASVQIPLSELERRARAHAILCTIGFLILLPIGVLVARYTRTLPYRWFWAHWTLQLLVSAPIILAGWVMGFRTSAVLARGHFRDAHQKMGLALLVLYLAQIALGAVVHVAKCPSVFRGRRAPHNYLHAALGLVIFGCAQWQVHYGLFTEWNFATGGLHRVPTSAKDAWLALVIVFWVLYGAGLTLIPRQFHQERQARKIRDDDTLQKDLNKNDNKAAA